MPILACQSGLELLVGFSPKTSTEPAFRGTRPLMISTVVVFPAPLGPSKATVCPRSTRKFRPSRTVTSPYFFVRLTTLTTASAFISPSLL